MSRRQERLELLDRYLRIPTISRQVTPEMVDEVRAFWRGVGLELEPLRSPDGQGTPALYGEIPGPAGAPTLLLYGHYDVQPTGDLARWRWEGVACQPFEPACFHGGKPVEPRSLDDRALEDVVLVARGGTDNKGQHLANILGALDAARGGTAQWTVKVILDGEEEHGSPHLDAIARAHRARLAADLLVGSDGPKQANQPTLVMGVRGLLVVDLVADNGQPASVHSGNYGNIVPNPVLPLARLIADIEERVRAYAAAHDAFRREASEVFARWEDKAVWKPFLWPTVNTNHLMTDGASPALRRTIIPRVVHARLDIRLTPDTPPAAVRQLVERAVADHGERAQGITFTARIDGQPASYTSPARPAFGWLLRLLEEEGGVEPVALPILGGTLPLHVFTEGLGIPTLWIPAANSDNQQHDVNEHYVLRHFYRQIALYARIVSSRPT
ncbi:MAG: M20/M25/M40 family metallo-hydrolase [Candidatus Rokubacteria bacterium]|nr:M20/M25/M40 family metallo-hydrolase [Candidatus Rokubacteria bacterium]